MPNRYPRPVTVSTSSSVPDLLQEFARVLTMWTPHVYSGGARVAACENGEGFRRNLGSLGRSVTRLGVQHDDLASYVTEVATAFLHADSDTEREARRQNTGASSTAGGSGLSGSSGSAEAGARSRGDDGSTSNAEDSAASDGASDGEGLPKSVAAVLAQARTQDGYHEKGENLTKFGRWYGMNGSPWCAMFVSWAFSKAGHPLPDVSGGPSGFASVREGYRYAKQKDRLVWKPQPGDVFLRKTHGAKGHTGIVTRVDYEKGIVYTIEGNTNGAGSRDGDGVFEKQHPMKYFNQGFWRPTGAIAASDKVCPKWGNVSWPTGTARKKKKRRKS